MSRKVVLPLLLAGMTLLLARAVRADIPAPPVNQFLGMLDVAPGNLATPQCRICHSSGVPDRHHLLYGKPIPPGSQVPYPDGNGDGVPDTRYNCVNCHGSNFTVERNCVVCHTASPHHTSAKAKGGNCKACHGSVVDNMNDGHYIPSYAPTAATPAPSHRYGLPLNSRRKGAGACDYCHDSDTLSRPPIARNSDLHHDPNFDCAWCHDSTFQQPPIRVCENCHGPDSLHRIQADSPAPGNRGTIVVEGEFPGYGHVGRNGAPGDSDCWGCHAAPGKFPPGSVPIIPTIQSTDRAVATAGKATIVVLQGAAFASTSGNTLQETQITLTAASGASTTLTPDVVVDQGMLAVTVPGSLPPGNYQLRASNAGLTSNAAAISVVPKVWIGKATAPVAQPKTVTISGGGFGGHQAGSGTGVTGTTSTGAMVKGTIVSWSPSKIVARFGAPPRKVTVQSVFGKATLKVTVP